MTFVYFSHLPDQKLIEQSVRSLHRLYDNPKIVVFWEKGKVGYLDGAQNLESDFDRQHNLNGLECCKEIVNHLLKVDDDIAVKMDSDTILTQKLETFENFLFFEAVQAFCGVGCCYAVSRHVLQLCSEKLNNYIAIPNCQYSEDLTISVLCQNVAHGTLKLWNGAEHIWGYPFNKDWAECAKRQVIHFGNPDIKHDPRFKKARDAAHMKMFLDWLDG